MTISKRRVSTAAAFCFCAIVFVPQSYAEVLRDIKDLAQETRDRAADARNRAVEARNSANEVLAHIRESNALLTEDMRNLATEAVEDLQQFILESTEGRAEFVADGGCSLDVCEPFRQELVAFLEDLQASTNALFDIAGLPGLHVSFQRFIDMIEDLSGRLLFPLYRRFGGENGFGAGMGNRLRQARTDLEVIRDGMEFERQSLSEGDKSRLDSELAKCQSWLDGGIATWDQTSLGVGALASAMKTASALVQGIMMLAGKQEISAGLAVVNAKLVTDQTDLASAFFDGVAEAAFWASNYVRNAAYYCSLIKAHDIVRRTILDPGCEDDDPKTPCETMTDPDAKSWSMLSTLRDHPEDGLELILQKQREIRQNQEMILEAVSRLKKGDLDNDGDVDLADQTLMQLGFTGPK